MDITLGVRYDLNDIMLAEDVVEGETLRGARNGR